MISFAGPLHPLAGYKLGCRISTHPVNGHVKLVKPVAKINVRKSLRICSSGHDHDVNGVFQAFFAITGGPGKRGYCLIPHGPHVTQVFIVWGFIEFLRRMVSPGRDQDNEIRVQGNELFGIENIPGPFAGKRVSGMGKFVEQIGLNGLFPP